MMSSSGGRHFVLVGSRDRARHRRLRPELYKLSWNVDLMEKLFNEIMAAENRNTVVVDSLQSHRERWIKSIKTSKLFMRQSVELCVSLSAWASLDTLLSMLERSLPSDTSSVSFWSELFSSLLTLTVERDDVTALRRLLNLAHSGEKPRLSEPIANCAALVTACNGSNPVLIKAMVTRGYRLQLRTHNVSMLAVLHELSSFSGGIGDSSVEGGSAKDPEDPDHDADEDGDEDEFGVKSARSADLSSESDAVHTLYVMRGMTNPLYVFACYEHMATTSTPPPCTCLSPSSPSESSYEICNCPLSDKFDPCDHCCLTHLECSDPMYLYLELSRVCRALGRATLESSAAFNGVADACDDMSVALLDLCQDVSEVELLLSESVGASKHFRREHVRKMIYPRLHVAVHQQHRALVGHGFSQQLLRRQWLGRVVQWPQRSFLYCSLYVLKQCVLTPLYVTLICTRQVMSDLTLNRVNSGQWSRGPRSIFKWVMGPANLDEPINRFISYSCSYLVFYTLLIISITMPVIQPRKSETENMQWYHLLLLGYTVSMVAHDATWARSVRRFTGQIQLWRLYDLLMHLVLCCSFVARFLVPHICDNEQCRVEEEQQYLAVSNSLLSVTTIMAGFRFLYWLQLTESVGPIIVSLTRVVKDLLAFLILYSLLGLAFTSGLAPLAVSSAAHRRSLSQCDNDDADCQVSVSEDSFDRLSGAVFWSMGKTFFWMIFSPDPPEGLFEGSRVDDVLIQLMFAVYTTLAVIVLLNLMIAVMNSTIGRVQDRQLLYWKFERTCVWMSFLSSESIVPIPFNVLFALRSLIKGVLKLLLKLCRIAVPGLLGQQRMTARQLGRRRRERERYEQLMLNIIKRHRKATTFPEHKKTNNNDNNNNKSNNSNSKSSTTSKQQ